MTNFGQISSSLDFPSGPKQMLVFDTPGNSTFSKGDHPWLSKVRVRCVGGGGGGAGARATDVDTITGGTPGSGAGYAESIIDASVLAADETVTVGAGGSGGSGLSDGGNGGNSSFGTHVIAAGGNGGNTRDRITINQIYDGTVGPSASASTGDITAGGGHSGPMLLSIDWNRVMAGKAGDSVLGGGAKGEQHNGNGVDGEKYGGGGGGCGRTKSQTVGSGGNGGDGVVIVELYA